MAPGAPHQLGFPRSHDAAPAAVRALAQHGGTTGRRWLSGCREVVCQVATKIALRRRKTFSIQDFNAESHCEFKPSIWSTHTDCTGPQDAMALPCT